MMIGKGEHRQCGGVTQGEHRLFRVGAAIALFGRGEGIRGKENKSTWNMARERSRRRSKVEKKVSRRRRQYTAKKEYRDCLVK